MLLSLSKINKSEKMLSQFSIFAVFISIASISTAPTSNNTIRDLFNNDSRVQQLARVSFVRGFCLRKNENLDSFSESLCLALYDVGVTFANKNMKLVEPTDTQSEGFCTELELALADKPMNTETTLSNGSSWLKDILKSPEGSAQCEQKCKFEDPVDYQTKTSPICRFLLQQLTTIQRLNVYAETKMKESAENLAAVNKLETKGKCRIQVKHLTHSSKLNI